MKFFFISILIAFSQNIWADSTVTEADFHKVVSSIQEIYQPLAHLHGGSLTINANWKADALNAYSSEFFGAWTTIVSGGVARSGEMTPDAFAMVICHELGHHFGGYPYMRAALPIMGSWGADEGEADYYSTQVCARKIWAHEGAENAKYREVVTPYLKTNCDSVWTTPEEQNICYRTGVAVEHLIVTMATYYGDPMPKFETPDPVVVTETYDDHAPSQCRMDTLFQGMLCTQANDDSIIPGHKVTGGRFSMAAEQQSAMLSCTSANHYKVGLRPVCWYKPRM